MPWADVGGEGAGQSRQDVYVQTEVGKPKRLHALLDGGEPKSYWTHWLNNVKRSVVCPGRALCPACKLGVKARMQHAMNVWDYTEKKVKILEKGNQVYEPIKASYEINGNSLDSIDIVIKQTGSGIDTKYIVASIPAGKIDGDVSGLHDLEVVCAPTAPDEIAKLLNQDPTSFNTDELEVAETAQEPTTDVSYDAVVMLTGKYKGKPLSEIVNLDYNYVKWVVENFQDEDALTAAKEALESKAVSPAPAPVVAKPKTANSALVDEALALVKEYQDKGGDLKDVAVIMKDIGKKAIIKDFTEAEAKKFIDSMKDLTESLIYTSDDSDG